MRAMKPLPLIGLLLLGSSVATSQEPLQAEIKHVELVDLATDHVTLEIRLRVQASRSIRVRQLTFHEIRLNGMPVHIGALTRPFELPADQFTVLAPLDATIYFRELPDLDALHRILQTSRAHLKGLARADLNLRWAARIALGSRTATAWAPFDAELRAELPGGLPGYAAALATLGLADGMMRGSAELHLLRERWLGSAHNASLGRTAVVRATIPLRTKSGQRTSLETTGIGILSATGQVLIPHAIIEPWRYDADLAAAVVRRQIRRKGKPRVHITASDSAAESVIPKIELGDCQDQRNFVVRGEQTTRVRLCAPSGPGALATGQLPAAWPPITPWARMPLRDGETREAIVFSVLGDGPTAPPTWETQFVSVTRRAGQLLLETPVSSAARGSPVLVDGRLVGQVQTEDQALYLTPTR